MNRCKGCNVPMWLEGRIYDEIPLCHPCYQDNDLRLKYTKEEEINQGMKVYEEGGLLHRKMLGLA